MTTRSTDGSAKESAVHGDVVPPSVPPKTSTEHERLDARIEQQAQRLERARRERATLIKQSVYLGTLGIMLVLPIVGGAYLGSWLDQRLQSYSVHWTLSLILIGIFVGAVNVYLFIRK